MENQLLKELTALIEAADKLADAVGEWADAPVPETEAEKAGEVALQDNMMDAQVRYMSIKLDGVIR